MSQEKRCGLTCRDGQRLAATIYEAPAPLAWVVINSALGVEQSRYATFARFLAHHGFAVVTYDFRGIAGSRLQKSPRRTSLRDWGEQDCDRVLGFALKQARQRPVFLVGDGIGGLLFSMASTASDLSFVLTVGTGCEDWRLRPAPARERRRFIATWIIPPVAAGFGWLPAFVLGCRLPGGVARQWAAAVRGGARTLFAPRGPSSSFKGRLEAWSVPGDRAMPPAAADRIHQFFPGARIKRRHLRLTVPSARLLEAEAALSWDEIRALLVDAVERPADRERAAPARPVRPLARTPSSGPRTAGDIARARRR